MSDTRIINSFPNHPKTKKLIKRLGGNGAWKLVCLFLWTANNKPDGILSNMTSEDIELAVDWNGEDGQFVVALTEIGFLDTNADVFSLHDWAVHNPWASDAPARKEKAQFAAISKHYGRDEAARRMPEYASRLLKAATSIPLADSSNAPSPSPSPSPSPKPKSVVPSSPVGFDEFWSSYPKKAKKPMAEAAWKKLKPDTELIKTIMGSLDRFKVCDQWVKDGGTYIPHPASWINQKRWQDEDISTSEPPINEHIARMMADGFIPKEAA